MAPRAAPDRSAMAGSRGSKTRTARRQLARPSDLAPAPTRIGRMAARQTPGRSVVDRSPLIATKAAKRLPARRSGSAREQILTGRTVPVPALRGSAAARRRGKPLVDRRRTARVDRVRRRAEIRSRSVELEQSRGLQLSIVARIDSSRRSNAATWPHSIMAARCPSQNRSLREWVVSSF